MTYSLKKWIALYLGTSLLFACSIGSNTPHDKSEQIKKGKRLASIYCTSCHLSPEPEHLPRQTWEDYVLPRMGYMLGIYPNDSMRRSLFEPSQAGIEVMQSNLFPETPRLSEEEWKAINTYFLESAPDSLLNTKAEMSDSLDQFQVTIPEYRLSPPSTTMIQIMENGGLFMADAHSEMLYQFDSQLGLGAAAKVKEGATGMIETDQEYLITVMGFFSPTDQALGFVMRLPKDGTSPPQVLLDHLQRPVHTSIADLNQDGRADLIISEYAKWTGALSWWEQEQDGSFEEHVLRKKPGAIRTSITDVNQDGLADVIALFGQGDEGIFLYQNQGEGKFTERSLLRFPPSYGSSYFTLLDRDQDGDLDILYTAGDNADYPPILKPYHGIYLYDNDGNWNFSQSWFYPLPGVYQARMEDFDSDGDMDIVAISFFPDFPTGGKEGFAFLHNLGYGEFKQYSFPEVSLGRWLVMDTGDIDKDGDIDIALGSLAFEVLSEGDEEERWVQYGIPFVVLENTLEK